MTRPGRAGGGATAEPLEPLQADDPVSVGRYVLDSRLAAGGMGTVYLGRDTAGRHVAVKLIRPDLAADHDFRERFRHEVAAARRVSPFCTASVLDADPDAYPPYLVTEYIEGRRLDRVVMEDGPLPASTLAGTAIGVATALTAIHHAGIVHRDLKPANVIMSLSGPRVIDFGIAKPAATVRHDLDRGLIFGTSGWMAPEQILDDPVGPAADIFTWGLLVGYAGTGRHPFTEPGRFGPAADASLGQRIVDAAPDLTGLAQPLRGLVEIALTKDPRARPAARDLLMRLVEGNADVNASTPIDQILGRTQRMAAVVPPTRLGPPAFATGYPPGQSAQPGQFGQSGQPGRFGQPARFAESAAQAPPPLYPPAAPPRPRRWWLLALAAALLLLVGWVALRSLRGNDSGGGPSAAPSSSATSSASPSQSPSAKAGIGVPVRDGQLEFTVTSVQCGVDQLKVTLITRHPDGQYCLVALTAHNVGSSTRNLSLAPQRLVDSAGADHDSSQLLSRAAFSEGIWGNLSEGDTASGTLVFDIPRDVTVDHLELHDGPFSDGATVLLR
ncbi:MULTISPECIES: serine/threonine-protein kinase [unclassified Frankia]|uniref:serine/threonine-protein kinase n=1 Tax=unclassified Frankia TaxID=2632575 RepID=UPI002AD2AA34|nr:MULTISPECIES: serine/threonine-protein kinase [unclassified Frankia]